MKSDALVVTFSDESYLPLLNEWLQRLWELEVKRIRVFCLDGPTREWCQSRGIEAREIEWAGTRRDLWIRRIRVFNELIARGEEFIHSDIDVVWAKNPLSCGSAVSLESDLVFSQGTIWPSETYNLWGFVLCCGWFWARPREASQNFFKLLEADVDTTGDDQISVNRCLAKMGIKWDCELVGDYQIAINQHLAARGLPTLDQDLAIRCWNRPIIGEISNASLSVALLPHREFQRLPDDPRFVVVEHHLSRH